MRIDHLLAIESSSYRASLAESIGQIAPGQCRSVSVLHEADGSCCARESWPITSSKILGPVVAGATGRNPDHVAALLAEHEPGILIVSRKDA
ncbi:MAG: hypothetical protein ACYDCA_09555 [Candidatus Tyrphobacter sp.]